MALPLILILIVLGIVWMLLPPDDYPPNGTGLAPA